MDIRKARDDIWFEKIERIGCSLLFRRAARGKSAPSLAFGTLKNPTRILERSESARLASSTSE